MPSGKSRGHGLITFRIAATTIARTSFLWPKLASRHLFACRYHVVGKPEGGARTVGEMGRENVPSTSDEYDPNWDLRGAIDDIRMLTHVGLGHCRWPGNASLEQRR